MAPYPSKFPDKKEAIAKEVWEYITRLLTTTSNVDDVISRLDNTIYGLNALRTSVLERLKKTDFDTRLSSDRAAKIDNIDSLLHDTSVLDFHIHGRWRAYPQNVTVAPTITAGTPANTFGSWAEVIPLNTVLFPFHVIGFCVCQVNAATNYFVQLGYNTINADPGTNMEMGERRIRIATVPIARQSELLAIYGQGVPANSRVMARMKTASGNPDTLNLSLVLTRHIEVTSPQALWPSFPW